MKRLSLLIIAGSFLIASCNKAKPVTDSDGNEHLSPDIIENPATASGKDEEKKLPVFSFSETRHDFGTITSGEVKTAEFKFRNAGNADLVIAQVTGSCGCTVPEYSKDKIEPGAEGWIKVTFNSRGQAGQLAKTITVLANTIPATKVLTISAEVISKK